MTFELHSLVYDKCVKDANGYGFADAGRDSLPPSVSLWPPPQPSPDSESAAYLNTAG